MKRLLIPLLVLLTLPSVVHSSHSNNQRKLTVTSESTKESIELAKYLKDNQSSRNSDAYTLNKKSLLEDVKMMHEFIEFKFFKKVMKRNNNILE